jgi:hypothetical protein
MATIMNNSGILFDDQTTQASRSDYVMRKYTSPATWDKPTALKSVKVTMVSGGGSGAAYAGTAQYQQGTGGGSGAYAVGYFPAPAITAPLTVTAGAGGAAKVAPDGTSSPGNAGGTSSFGSLMSVTGGSGGITQPAAASPGSGVQPGAAGGSGTNSASVLAVSGITSSVASQTGSPGADAALRYGIGGIYGIITTAATAGTGFGSGGGAQVNESRFPNGAMTSGAGAPGFVIVEEFY